MQPTRAPLNQRRRKQSMSINIWIQDPAKRIRMGRKSQANLKSRWRRNETILKSEEQIEQQPDQPHSDELIQQHMQRKTQPNTHTLNEHETESGARGSSDPAAKSKRGK
jgi:hypothetical protein